MILQTWCCMLLLHPACWRQPALVLSFDMAGEPQSFWDDCAHKDELDAKRQAKISLQRSSSLTQSENNFRFKLGYSGPWKSHKMEIPPCLWTNSFSTWSVSVCIFFLSCQIRACLAATCGCCLLLSNSEKSLAPPSRELFLLAEGFDEIPPYPSILQAEETCSTSLSSDFMCSGLQLSGLSLDSFQLANISHLLISPKLGTDAASQALSWSIPLVFLVMRFC